MQTIKTAFVVVLLLGVCYGAYVAFNAPDPVLPPEIGLDEDWATQTPKINFDETGSVAVDIPQLNPAPSSPSLTPPALPTLDNPAESNRSVPGTTVSMNSGPDAATKADGPSVPLPSFDESKSNTSASTNLPMAALPGSDMPKLELPKLGEPNIALPVSSSPSLAEKTSNPSEPKLPDAFASNAATGGSASSVKESGPAVALPDSETDLLGPAPSTPSLPPAIAPSANLPSSNPSAPLNPLARSTSPGAPTAPAARPKKSFEDAKQEALKMAASGKLKEALVEMSLFYNSPEVTHEQHLDLIDLLDALAAEVIYSKRHFLAPPYPVSAGETLEAIAAKHKVSPELLARINGMGDSKIVLAGTQLKTINGPFRADVNINKGELTLFLGDMYAGRFPISIGSDPAPREGSFEITDKRRDRTYYGLGGNVLKGDDPRNPYGGIWLSLGQDICIHGTPEMSSAESNKAGCISLSPIDAKDVYMILAQGNRVTIHR